MVLLDANATDPAPSAKNIYFSFQYNPEKLNHTINQPSLDPATQNRNQQASLTEFFNLSFDLDSIDIDASAQGQISNDFGLHPALAMLQLMTKPQTIGSGKPSLPIVVFKWGAKRSVAAQIVSLFVEEKAFDLTLNPTRATVNLTLRVLDDSDVLGNQAARKVVAAHEETKKGLVEVYKSQTGQTPASTISTVAAATGISAGKASAGGKTKKSA